MGKILLAAAVASLSFFQGGHMADGITINPDPPKRGKPATITYKPNTGLRIEFDPGGLDRATTDVNGDVTIQIPANCGTITVWDPNDPGGAESWTCTP